MVGGRLPAVSPVTDGTKVTENLARRHYDFRTTAHVVKPRKPHDEQREIIAIVDDIVWTEHSGEIHPRASLPEILTTHPSSILACENAPKLLLDMDAVFRSWPGWQWRVTPVTRRKYHNHRTTRVTETRGAVVNYMGFRFPIGEGDRYRTYYHYPVDTMTFLGGSIAKAFDGDPLPALIAWAYDLREFARENALKVTPTSGGLAAQLLRDPRFFPTPRRKVPRATNEKARPHLPGNHYELFVPENVTIPRALYLDMTGAHHHAAAGLTFPDPNRMYARGRYRNPPETVSDGDPWARSGTRKFDAVIATHGLFLLRINVPHKARMEVGRFPPPWLSGASQGARLAWVYSNELPMIADHGALIEGIEAAWTAARTDDGLNRYAEWSIAETARMEPTRRAWAKATLLAAYGMLAARPRQREFGYKHAKRGEPAVYMTSGGPLQVEALTTKRELDSPVANVIARGMVEAEVRREVLTLARELHAHGAQVIAVYADSIIVSDNSWSAPLPLLPGHWHVKSRLTQLEFFNAVSFRAEEMVRLPGIPATRNPPPESLAVRMAGE